MVQQIDRPAGFNRATFFRRRGQGQSQAMTNNNTGNICPKVDFLQINLHHCIAAMQNFNERVFSSKTEKICLVQEPYLARNRISGIHKDLKVISGTGNKPRACIVTTPGIQYWVLTQFTDSDQVAIIVKCDGKYVVIASLYLPGLPESVTAPPTKNFRDLVAYCERYNYGLIVGTDANSHHTVWGSTDTNARGEHLLDYILSRNLHVANVGNAPTYQNIRGKEVLDLTLLSNHTLDLISGWKVSDTESLSDHNYIEFTLNSAVKVNEKYFRNIKKTDWGLYNEKVKEGMALIADLNLDLNTKAKYLNKVYLSAFHDSCRLSRVGNGKKPPWWTHDLTNLKKEVNKARRKMKRNPTPDRVETYTKTRRTYKNEVKWAKSKGWRDFCTDLKDMTTTARLQRILKLGKRQEIGNLKKSDGTYTETPSETVNLLMDIHFPKRTINIDSNDTDTIADTNNRLNIEEVINESAVKASITSFKPYKSPGTDGIFPVLLQKSLDSTLSYITNLYRLCLKEGKTPAAWLDSKISFIPKPGKTDYG